MNEMQGLSPKAYEISDGETYPSYVSHDQNLPELSAKAIISGIIIGTVFGAANAYLGLKVGLTVSASIPAAVMAVAIFRIFFKGGSILETNMVQTIGSAGESLAAGVIFTIPALFIWGMEPSKLEIAIIAFLGGFMGVLFMIPLRRYLIVREHGKLPYPEGTACAEVLVAGQGDLSKAKTLFQGLSVGAIYQALMHDRLFGLWNKEPSSAIPGFKGAELGAEVTPELLGVGYIIGPQISAVMLSGGVLGWLVLIPLIYLFGDGLTTPVYPETESLISAMEPGMIWSRYIRYIGAGGVAFAGIFSLLKSIPVIITSFKLSISQMGRDKGGEIRTQQDLPTCVIFAGSLILAVLTAVFLVADTFNSNAVAGIITAVLVVIFGFFFVTVSSRIVGLLGSSSNPISGMTIATLLLTCVMFLLAGLDVLPNVKLAVLTVGAFVCIAAAIAGDTSQDLKTGFLIGATPRLQQIGELIGVAASALTMGWVMYLMRDAIVMGELPAPQANLMRLVIDGVLGGNLPWNLVFCGMFVALCVELLGINSLAFAVGLYLPLSLSVPIMVGGAIRWFLESGKNDAQLERRRESGVLYSSGLIAGAALTGVMIMVLVGISEASPRFLEMISRPGIYFNVDPSAECYVNGTKIATAYLPVAVEDFPDTSEKVAELSRLRKQLEDSVKTPAGNESAEKLKREIEKVGAELDTMKSKNFDLRCRIGSKEYSKTIEVSPWDKIHIQLMDKVEITPSDKIPMKLLVKELVTSNLPPWADKAAVAAFALLSGTLLWVIRRKKS